MAKMVTRTVQSTIIRFRTVGIDQDGNVTTGPEASDLIPEVKITDKKKAAQVIRKRYPDVDLIITGIDSIEEVRGITLEAFMEHSVVIERPESQQKKS